MGRLLCCFGRGDGPADAPPASLRYAKHPHQRPATPGPAGRNDRANAGRTTADKILMSALVDMDASAPLRPPAAEASPVSYIVPLHPLAKNLAIVSGLGGRSRAGGWRVRVGEARDCLGYGVGAPPASKGSRAWRGTPDKAAEVDAGVHGVPPR